GYHAAAYVETTLGWLAGFTFRDNECWGSSGNSLWIAGDAGMSVDGFKTDGDIFAYSPKSNANFGYLPIRNVIADSIAIAGGIGELVGFQTRDLSFGGGVVNAGWDIADG